MRRAGLAVAMLLAAGSARAADVTGNWLTEDRSGVIAIAPCGDAVCGRIVGVTGWKPGTPAPVDSHGTPQCGLTFIYGMRPGDDGRLHGHLTNPKDGQVYTAMLWLGDDGALRLRGYVAIPLLGQTQRWTRYDKPVPADCRLNG